MAGPTQAGFVAFVRGQMGIGPSVLPDDSNYLVWAYDVALAIVNRALAAVPPIYMLAIYNLAGDNLINYAQDTPPSTYFADLRKTWGINSFVAGVITSSSDEGTSESLTVPDAFKNLTIADLQNLKTPYGRTYLGFAQRYGTLWGIS